MFKTIYIILRGNVMSASCIAICHLTEALNGTVVCYEWSLGSLQCKIF